MDRIPSNQLRLDPIIVAFYTNVHSMQIREKLSMHVVHTLDELWERSNRCTRGEKARDYPFVEVV